MKSCATDTRTLRRTGESQYARAVQKDLNDLKSADKDLNAIITKLEEPGKVHTISMVASPDEKTTYGNGCNLNSEKDAATKGVGTGSSINYNPWNKSAGDPSIPEKRADRPAKIGLAHELGHSWNAHRGTANFGKTSNGVSFFEVQAVDVENIARAAYGVKERSIYNGISIRNYLPRRQ